MYDVIKGISNKSRSHTSKLLASSFFIALFLLILQISANTTDTNDGWILEGLVPSFLLLTLVYSIIVGFSSDLKLIAIISAIYLVAINMIPNLKYAFIYGYHDPLNHYGSIKETIALGNVSELGIYEEQYAATPGMHILVSELSIITGSSALTAMKLFLILRPLILPLAVYFVVKKLDVSNGLAKAIIAAVDL